MTAFIQTVGGAFANVNTFSAAKGFESLGREVLTFDASELEMLPLGEGTMVCGFVGVVLRALERVGAGRPVLHSTPACLGPWLGRRIAESTLGEAKARRDAVFLKPLHAHKAFPGYVRRNAYDDLGRTAGLDDALPVLVSEVVEFVAEWRCFVLRGEVLDARRYSGTYRTASPDWSVLDGALEALGAGAPAGFAIDLGLTSDGRTLIVELSDGYSLGTYGLGAAPYARLLEARWDELVFSRAE